ncbi:atlastin-3-like [Paramacrobiotus metropolitanus]|uniref:atlastin-3-like n=1 Tax=Paramacrobiotus metropolitanus TaxID=2943436 RepID=UPI0024464887|nr:atlastin-3-like [Paramacrobiotus metropolitanus]
MASFLVPIAVKDGDELTLSEVGGFVERLKGDDVKDINICLVGVVGKFREGKSTLLNIMDRYLTQRAAGNASPDPRKYVFGTDKFVTSKETDGCTQGIWITRNPYIIQDSKGQKFAIFLLDTQGLFDFENSTALDSALFLLTSMFSSFTIFNIMRILGKDQLDMLAEFSKLAQKIRSNIYSENAHIFQDLIILVRDALLGKMSPGWESGAAYLDKSLNTTKNAYIMKEITKAYQQLRCFLMPRIANDPDDQEFSMTEEHILPDFLQYVNVFLNEMFGVRMLRPFQHKDTVYNCGAFAGFVEHITELFVGGKIPKAENMLEAMVRFELQVAVDLAFKYYRSNMTMVTSQGVDPEKLKEMHALYKENCKLINQNEVAILAREPIKAKPFLKKLDESIDEEFTGIAAANDQRLQQEAEHRAELDKRQHEVEETREAARRQLEEQKESMQKMEAAMKDMANKSAAERKAAQDALQAAKDEFAKATKANKDTEAKQAKELADLKKQKAEDAEKAKQHSATLTQLTTEADTLRRQLQDAVNTLSHWKSQAAQPVGFWEGLGQVASFGIYDPRREAREKQKSAQAKYDEIQQQLASVTNRISNLGKGN